MVYPSEASVGQSFSNQVVGLRRHAKVLLLEDHGSLVVPQGFVGQSQVAVGAALATHTARVLGYIQSPLVPLEQGIDRDNNVMYLIFKGPMCNFYKDQLV